MTPRTFQRLLWAVAFLALLAVVYRNITIFVVQPIGALPNGVTLLLDVPVETGLVRANQRSAPDRFEREQREFFERMRAAYLERARHEPQRVHVIDAARDLAAVQTQLQAVLATLPRN